MINPVVSRKRAWLIAIGAAFAAVACIIALAAPKAQADHTAGIVSHPGEPLGWGVVCSPAHLNKAVDPILGFSEGETHMHQFFGGMKGGDVFASTSPTSLRNFNVTSCKHNADDALYWLPKPNATVSTFVAYYKPNPLTDNGSIGIIPGGLEMIAGSDPTAGSGTNPSPYVDWGCNGSPANAENPNTVTCGATGKVKLEILFPDCVELDGSGSPINTSGNGRNHVKYSNNGVCGSGYRHIPQLHEHFIFDENNGANLNFSVPWYDVHADFMNGWDQTKLQTAINTCIVSANGGCLRIYN